MLRFGLQRRVKHAALAQHRSARAPDFAVTDDLAAQSIGDMLDEDPPTRGCSGAAQRMI
jgi:hypothetical protein